MMLIKRGLRCNLQGCPCPKVFLCVLGLWGRLRFVGSIGTRYSVDADGGLRRAGGTRCRVRTWFTVFNLKFQLGPSAVSGLQQSQFQISELLIVQRKLARMNMWERC